MSDLYFVKRVAWHEMCTERGDPFLIECDAQRDEFFHDYEQLVWERIQNLIVQWGELDFENG